MNHGYCVYFGDKPYFITSHMNERLYALTCRGGTILLNQPTPGAILQTIQDLDKTEAEAAIILTNHRDHYWQIFTERFTPVQAAGGLVTNPEGESLFIYRRGKWDLPKGKLDPGESMEQCALREVREETGLTNIELDGFLGDTWHTYHERGCFWLKQTAWYKMRATAGQTLTPQAEEDITAIKWLPRELWSDVQDQTYASIREVLKLAESDDLV